MHPTRAARCAASRAAGGRYNHRLVTASTNRLTDESSPYLRLHRHNPVDWYPWGEEALARARREDKPIFLSVGYSTCHWCHVMERESFADPAVAEVMNGAFVNIKVDREERPDLDEVYMAATQLLAGQGGWPNSVFLTPALEPFFAGTYFPPEDRWGRPGFVTVLRSLAEAWRTRREEIEGRAHEVAAAVRRGLAAAPAPATGPPAAGSEAARACLDALARAHDPVWGGFGGAPKFPSPGNLLLLDHLAPARERAAEMLALTLDRMARGGIYDQLAGGFHRYATDREWRVPHFEKMLYDNGLLLEVYARHFGRTGEPEAERIAREAARFLVAELGAPEGGFWSAIGADSDGEEGAYYVWRHSELEAVLGAEGAAFLAPLYGFDVAPFFEGDRYVLHVPAPWIDQARRRATSREALLAELEPLRRRLLEARARRPRPLTDDKVLTDWNGMAISGLAAAGRLLAEPALVERAAAAAAFVLAALRGADGALLHSRRGARAGEPAFLADYVWMVRGLLALHEASGDRLWLAEAVRLAEEQERRLGAPDGTYWGAAERADLLARGKELFDAAVPAANPVAGLNLAALFAATGEATWAARGGRLLAACAGLLERPSSGLATLALAALRWRDVEVARGEAAGASARLAAQARDIVSPQLTVEAPGGDGWRRFTLRLRIAPGWHLAAPGEAHGLELGGQDVELADLQLPAAESPDGAAVLRGEAVLAARLRTRGASPALRLAYQACDESRCLLPVGVELPLAG